jgi:uncharacterized protein (DUF3820 family)
MMKLSDRIIFGKYKGKRSRDLPEDYAGWLLDR